MIGKYKYLRVTAVFCVLHVCLPVQAHHVLGRPSYSLSEDSTTPPSMQVETQIGDYYVTYMAFPANRSILMIMKMLHSRGRPGCVIVMACYSDELYPWNYFHGHF